MTPQWLIIWSLIESSNSSGEPIQNPIRTSLTLARKKKRLFDDPEPEDDPKGNLKPKIRPKPEIRPETWHKPYYFFQVKLKKIIPNFQKQIR